MSKRHNRNAPILPGQRYEKRRPFIQEEVDAWNRTITQWHLGTYETARGEGHDGFGLEIRTVVAVVDLPPPYRPRVFYTRSFEAPDGYTFGAKGLRCTAVPAFKAWRNDFSDPATLVEGEPE